MYINNSNVEEVTLRDIMGMASWERERSTDELRDFVESHHALIPVDIEL